MSMTMARRITAATVVTLMALTIPGAPTWAATETKVAQPAPGPTGEAVALPQPHITQQAALDRLKQYFAVPAETASVSVEGSLSSRNGHLTWDFMVTVQEGNGSSGSGFAAVDAMTGRILYYHGLDFVPRPIATGPLAPARPEAEAREKAWALVQAMYPDAVPDLKPADPLLSRSDAYTYYGVGAPADNYQFTWTLYPNGVPYAGSAITVSLDKATLAYTGLTANLPEGMNFPAGPAKLTPEAAMSVWTNSLAPQLSYMPLLAKSYYGGGTPTEFRLVYQFTAPGRTVDAMTGKLSDLLPGGQPAGQPEAVPAAGDVKPVIAPAPLSEDQAYTLAAELLGLPEGSELRQEMRGYPDPNIIPFWSQGPDNQGMVGIDRETGLLRTANRNFMSRADQGPTVPVERSPELDAKAKQAAIAVVQRYYSPMVKELRVTQAPQWPDFMPDDGTARFTFQRYVNDIPVSTDNIEVSIDLRTLQWQSINASWTTGVAFPSPVRAITPADAAIAFYAGRQPVLIYQAVPVPYRPGMGWNLNESKEATLVYKLAGGPDAYLVDALTGRLLTWDGQAPDAMTAAWKRIQGHWAEGELRYLLANQAIEASSFNPDGTVTRMQAVQMLLLRQRRMRNPAEPVTLPFSDIKRNDPNYAQLAEAFAEGWLSPGAADGLFRPDQPISRAEFAVWATRALGLGALARSGLATEPAYTDLRGLPGEEQNALAFLRALGLVKPADRFRALEPLTQAEGAAITVRIYNYLLK